jgi:hypothetical protein
MQEILFFVQPETLQAVRIRELAESPELFGLKRVLQFVGHRHVGHGRDYNKLYKLALRRRSAFTITETELKVIAALAMIGLSSKPKIG